MVLTGRLWMTQIVYRDRLAKTKKQKKFAQVSNAQGVAPGWRYKFGNSLSLKLMEQDEIIWE